MFKALQVAPPYQFRYPYSPVVACDKSQSADICWQPYPSPSPHYYRLYGVLRQPRFRTTVPQSKRFWFKDLEDQIGQYFDNENKQYKFLPLKPELYAIVELIEAIEKTEKNLENILNIIKKICQNLSQIKLPTEHKELLKKIQQLASVRLKELNQLKIHAMVPAFQSRRSFWEKVLEDIHAVSQEEGLTASFYLWQQEFIQKWVHYSLNEAILRTQNQLQESYESQVLSTANQLIQFLEDHTSIRQELDHQHPWHERYRLVLFYLKIRIMEMTTVL